MNSVGFNANIKKTKNENLRNINENDKLISFDSGNCITFEDACHHVLVLGTTGSGKTTSTILPLFSRLLQDNQGGLVVDMKGNLRNQIRGLAQHFGREDDIIEIGTASSAKPINLLRDLSMIEVHELFTTILHNLFEGKTGNLDFHMRGITQATHCVEFLLILEKIFDINCLSIEFVGQLLNSPMIASKLYLNYEEIFFDENNPLEKDFVTRIRSNKFSLFHYASDNNGIKTYNEQLMYEINSVRDAINNFIKTSGIIHGFSNLEAGSLDMSQYLNDRKIIVLRFGPETGAIGIGLSRKIIQDYYQHIYDLGTEEAQKKPSFICLDEFQDVALLDGSRFSDSQFISQAREFKSTFIASTQSVSALNCRNNTPSMVNSFVSNCNNRILFYSDDPETQKLAERSSPTIYLNNLEPCQAFVNSYCSETRTYNQGIETLNKVYEHTQYIIKKTPL